MNINRLQRVRGHVVAALAAVLVVVCASGSVIAQDRDEAVALARAGQLDAAVEMLERLRQARPDDPALLHDLLTVLSWAGRHQRAATLAAQADPDSLPAYALRAVAGSMLRTAGATAALPWYESLVASADSVDADYADYARTLADAGDPGQAGSVARTARQRFGASAENLHALGYAEFGQGRYAHALAACDAALALVPGHAPATRLKARSLQRLGATGPAVRFAEARHELLTVDAQMQVANDRNATWVRWGALDQGSMETAYRDTDIALARLDALEARARQFPGIAEELMRVIRFDRIVALHDRLKMRDAVTVYESLVADGIGVPAYAARAAAGAYLYLREPARAEALYREVIEAQPRDVEARNGLFYALLEQEDFSAARDVIENLVDNLDKFRRSDNGRHVYPDYDWLGASITAAMMEAYADKLDRALEELQALRSRSPHDGRLHRELSTLYRWRGWANAALEQARIGRTNFPEEAGLVLAEAAALMDLRRYREAEQAAGTLFAGLPDNTAVQRFGRDLDAFHSPVLEMSVSRTHSDPSNVVSGERGLAFGLRLDSAPVDYRSRFFAALDRRSSTFPEGDRRHDRFAAGYAYRYGPYHGSVAATGSEGDVDESGVAVSLGFRAGDHFALDLAYDSVSLESPLRGLDDGTYADRLQLSVAWTFHESRRLAFDAGTMDFTDGNRRDFAAAAWEERWYAGPVYRLTTFLEGYASENSIGGVDYFNPESDRDVNLTVRQRWKTWREYERAFHQVLDLSVGRYSQEGFEDGDTWSIRYEHTFEHEDEYVLSYGIRRGRDVYDGEPEYVDELFLRYNRIF